MNHSLVLLPSLIHVSAAHSLVCVYVVSAQTEQDVLRKISQWNQQGKEGKGWQWIFSWVRSRAPPEVVVPWISKDPSEARGGGGWTGTSLSRHDGTLHLFIRFLPSSGKCSSALLLLFKIWTAEETTLTHTHLGGNKLFKARLWIGRIYSRSCQTLWGDYYTQYIINPKTAPNNKRAAKPIRNFAVVVSSFTLPPTFKDDVSGKNPKWKCGGEEEEEEGGGGVKFILVASLAYYY